MDWSCPAPILSGKRHVTSSIVSTARSPWISSAARFTSLRCVFPPQPIACTVGWLKALNPGVWGGAPIAADCPLRGARSEHLGRRPVAQRLMRPALVVEPEIVLQCHPQLPPVGIVPRVDQFVLHRAPQSLDENIVQLYRTRFLGQFF